MDSSYPIPYICTCRSSIFCCVLIRLNLLVWPPPISNNLSKTPQFYQTKPCHLEPLINDQLSYATATTSRLTVFRFSIVLTSWMQPFAFTVCTTQLRVFEIHSVTTWPNPYYTKEIVRNKFSFLFPVYTLWYDSCKH